MKKVPLKHGQFALVDDEDFDRIIKGKWRGFQAAKYSDFYADAYLSKKDFPDVVQRRVYMHRFIMGVSDRRIQVDHINGNGLDNRKSNLRLCSHQENTSNKKKKAATKFPYKGITQTKSGSYEARIKVLYKTIRLGLFDNLEQAARAYDAAARVHHGEFANLNFPNE